jgi:hypothetical protein
MLKHPTPWQWAYHWFEMFDEALQALERHTLCQKNSDCLCFRTLIVTSTRAHELTQQSGNCTELLPLLPAVSTDSCMKTQRRHMENFVML